MLSPLEQEAAMEFARRTRDTFGHRAKELRIFGSRARGEAREDSDLDIWVLLDEAPTVDRDAVSDLAYDLYLEMDLPFIISPRIMSAGQYGKLRSLERLLPKEIERDGIPL
jgi:predicted nucleotidyltransferase